MNLAIRIQIPVGPCFDDFSRGVSSRYGSTMGYTLCIALFYGMVANGGVRSMSRVKIVNCEQMGEEEFDSGLMV